MTEDDRKSHISNSEILAEACSTLTTVVDFSNALQPHFAARISRDSVGNVIKVEAGHAYGMLVGHEDKAFPRCRE